MCKRSFPWFSSIHALGKKLLTICKLKQKGIKTSETNLHSRRLSIFYCLEHYVAINSYRKTLCEYCCHFEGKKNITELFMPHFAEHEQMRFCISGGLVLKTVSLVI